MNKTYKFRLYPTKDNEQKLLWTLDKCRHVYNILLDRLNEQKVIDKNQIQGDVTDLKRIYPELKEVHSKTLQYECYRLFSNLRALSKTKEKGRKVGRLRFKGKNWFKTFSYNQSGFKIIEHNTRYDKLWLSKIGEIPFIKHREIKGKIKHITVKHVPSGKWYASIIAETKEDITKTNNKKKVGIDLGLDNFVYDSDENKIKSPRLLRKSEKQLAKEQRKLSRKKKKSNNRIKQKIKVVRVHEKITNQRNDFLQKLSRQYVNRYGLIVFEKLQINNMVKNHHLAKSIMDASWSKFIQFTQYKAERAGVEVIQVNPRNTTQICSSCGNKVHKELWNRTHKCSCGLKIDRDYNSAINILNIGQELSKSTLVGDVSLETSMNQEATFSNPIKGFRYG